MRTVSRSRELAKVYATGAITLVVAAFTGSLAGLSLNQWLIFGLGASLVLWVGGAASGQIILARILDRGTGQQVLDYLHQLMWIIPRVFVPLGLVAVACGIALVIRSDVSFSSAGVLVPLALFVATAVAGSVVNAPGYLRLTRFAADRGADHPDVRRRLMPLLWVNRVELALVVGVGFALLSGAIS